MTFIKIKNKKKKTNYNCLFHVERDINVLYDALNLHIDLILIVHCTISNDSFPIDVTDWNARIKSKNKIT